MSDVTDSFRRDGYVVIEDAMDPALCESVVVEALAGLGHGATGRHNLPARRSWTLDDAAPAAAAALDELLGGREAIAFSGIHDNLIVNLADPGATWWAPHEADAPGAGWHKDGDWFRHFLDSPEQGILGIVLWRDVDADQGATYVVADSIGPVARLLADRPQGVEPPVPVDDIVRSCSDFRALTGRQGTLIWAHPFLVHSASVNGTDRPRVISNTVAILREPMCFDRPDGRHTPVEQAVLDRLGVERLAFHPTGPRGRIESERERRWRDAQSTS
jgi:ectoine hydroxylase-related dioxygenase (phytanoyl-CoA dioxygenase family)